MTQKLGRVRALPCLCGFYPAICLTTEENGRKNLSQGFLLITKEPYFLPANIVIPHMSNFVTQRQVKVKVTLVQALRLCTGRTAQMVSRGIALIFHDYDTRRG